MAARSATDVWAVGTRVDRSGAIPIDRTLTEHWNGTSWSVVASPNVGANDNLLNGVSATPGDVWAVGSSNVIAHTLILREPADESSATLRRLRAAKAQRIGRYTRGLDQSCPPGWMRSLRFSE